MKRTIDNTSVLSPQAPQTDPTAQPGAAKKQRNAGMY